VTTDETKNSAAVGRSDLEGVVMRDEALKWRVRFETPDGMYTFTDISKRGGFKLDRSEVEDWAETQVRANHGRYAKVAAVLNLDGDGA